MAANPEQIVKIDVDDTSNGHNIHYSFNMRSLAMTESWPLIQDYTTNCPVLPTSWTLAITYKQIPETGEVSCFVTLTRIDLASASVEATVSISILDKEKHFVRYPRPICSSQMLTTETIQGTFEDSRDPGLKNYVLSLEFILRITVLIRSCHLTENFDRQKYFSSNVKDKRRSKK
ncbi:hypothetical protein AVEN_161598-1 [Araneus ventricosus]|uniref:MATH domain-containing protein n=1 Tax=Araneus ventricosus TaxID=182803 RepID=A0A4Y2FMY9_ARAVE|nr:hypothetical protein AVEN_161598-1 [Araneus ventricosus]